ncbi:Fc.00g010040.m01.CDS01 [Cosmosporella sp. VM-42]
MAGLAFKIGLPLVALFGVLFQVLKVPVSLGLGIGRVIEPLSNFPYTCRRIEHPRMEACEDIWLSQSTRQLFLACSDPNSRPYWMPNVAHFNISARSQKDAIVALEIDKPDGDSFELRVLKTPEYTGTAGDGLLDVAGFTGIDNPKTGGVELLIINNRPSVDAVTGEYSDQLATGANITIELFETGPDAEELKHIRTYADKLIATPNRVAALDSENFYITNDHGPHKFGLQHHISPFLGTGDVTFCRNGAGCKKVAGGFKFPNGLTRGKDGLIYVPNSMIGTIDIFKVLSDSGLEKVDSIFAGYGLDNLSSDENGDIYVAAFPKGIDIFKAYNDPYNARPPATALKLRKQDGRYIVEKVIEDAHGEALPAATTVVHDAKTGRLFFSSVISPFISVCEPKK